ncbi:MAG: nuclease, partial [Bacteroidota bacterium]
MRKIVLLCCGLFLSAGIWAQNAGDLILTAVYDGTLTGGVPKGIELYVANDIADLSAFGVGSANNGTGSTGAEYTFPAVSAQAGEYLYLTSDSLAFIEFFGTNPDFADVDDGSVNVNGDDAIELFLNGVVTDVFG